MTRSSRDYKAYGLHIRSSINLPFAPLPGSPTGEPDVRISFGKTPAAIPSPVTERGPKSDHLHGWKASEGNFLINVPGLARYHVTGGHDVMISPYGGSDHDIGVFLIGRVFAALLQQQGLTTFHTSAIATETGAVLFMGTSGIGKSSLLAALLNYGYPLVADDMTGVTRDAAGRLTVVPAFPCISLREDTLDMVGWRERAQMSVREGSEKHWLSVERFRPSPIPLHAIYILRRSYRQDVRIERLPTSHTFKWLYKYSYRKQLLYGLRQMGTHFRTLTAISREIPVSLVERPAHPFLLDVLADRIDADLRGESLPHGNDAAAGQAVSRAVG